MADAYDKLLNDIRTEIHGIKDTRLRYAILSMAWASLRGIKKGLKLAKDNQSDVQALADCEAGDGGCDPPAQPPPMLPPDP